MTTPENEARLAAIRKNISLLSAINIVPNIALGLGLFGLFAAKHDTAFPFLNDPQNCYALIGASLLIEVMTLGKFFSLVREKQKILGSGKP